MTKMAFFSLPLLVLLGCNSTSQPAQLPYPYPGQYPQQVPQAVPGQYPEIPGQPAPPVGGTPPRSPDKPASLWMPGEPLPPTFGTGAASPDEFGRTIVQAFNTRNTAGVLALFPSKGQLSAILECTGSGDQFGEMEKTRNALANELYDAWKRNEIYSLVAVSAGDSIMNMARGTERKGCTAADDIAIRKYVVSLTINRNGQATTGRHAYVLLHIGSLNRWFVVDD